MPQGNLANYRSNKERSAEAHCRSNCEAELEVPPTTNRGFWRELRQSGSQQCARSGNWRQLRIETLTVRSGEIGNCCLDLRHSRTAVPTGRQVSANFGNAVCRKFAIGGQQQLFIGRMKMLAAHKFSSCLHASIVPAIESANWILLRVTFQVLPRFPGTAVPQPAGAGSIAPPAAARQELLAIAYVFA